MRDVKRHGHIIALSQSELMLVIALIFLLLFYMLGTPAKNQEEDIPETEPKLTPSNEEPPTPVEEVEEDKEVQEELDREHDQPQEQGEEPTLAPGSDEVAASTTEQENLDEEVLQELVLMLEESGLVDETTLATEDQGEIALAAVEQALEQLKEGKDLQADVDQLLRDSQIEHQGDASASLRELGKRLEDYNEIGFVPCWRGDGATRYYRTFHMTYLDTTGLYSIERHPDWNSVPQGIRSRMPALEEYPRGQVDREAMADYARKLNAQKVSAHGPNCRLVTTINTEADGKIISDINQMNLYPIYRD